MTITRQITVTCDDCFDMLTSDSFVADHLGSVWAAEHGWAYDTEGHNWCPSCSPNHTKKKGRRRDPVRP